MRAFAVVLALATVVACTEDLVTSEIPNPPQTPGIRHFSFGEMIASGPALAPLDSVRVGTYSVEVNRRFPGGLCGASLNAELTSNSNNVTVTIRQQPMPTCQVVAEARIFYRLILDLPIGQYRLRIHETTLLNPAGTVTVDRTVFVPGPD